MAADYLRPSSLNEACQMRSSHQDYMVIAGCTDVLVDSAKRASAPGLIDLFGLSEIANISEDGDDIFVGAAVTYADVLSSDLIKTHLPMLQSASRLIGAMQIQERGTLGGNVVTSSPVGDTLVVWLAADAHIDVASVRGTRTIPYEEFITGYRQTDLAADELVVGFRFSKRAEHWDQHFRKVGTRAAQSISKVMLAAVSEMQDGRVTMIRMALGAVADRTIRVSQAEELVIGQVPTPELAEKVRASVIDSIAPIDDLRSSADYRKHIAARLCAAYVTSLSGDS